MTSGTAVIVRTNIESRAHENIIAYVDNRSYVRDPRNPAGVSGRQFVYDSDPFHKAINFSDMPYVVIEFPRIAQTSPTADGKHKRIQWEQTLIVRAARDGSANTRSDVGRQDMMDISDSLFALFNDMTIKKELFLLNINEIVLEKTSIDTIMIKQQEAYEAEYILTYWSRITTSA